MNPPLRQPKTSGIPHGKLRTTVTYILSKDLPEIESLGYEQRRKEKWAAYQHRLQKIKTSLPASAQEFAFADWHYDFSDSRCPHDAWLEYVTIREPSSGERSEVRGLEIEIKLFGAYHDGYLEFRYTDVESYFFDQPHRRGGWHSTENGHGDWMIDEVDLSSNGYVLHEIEWLDGGHWLIECRDLVFTWLSKE